MLNTNNKMRLRKTYLIEDVTLNTTGTKTYNLDFTDPIVAIYLDFQGKRYDKSDTNRPYLLVPVVFNVTSSIKYVFLNLMLLLVFSKRP